MAEREDGSDSRREGGRDWWGGVVVATREEESTGGRGMRVCVCVTRSGEAECRACGDEFIGSTEVQLDEWMDTLVDHCGPLW